MLRILELIVSILKLNIFKGTLRPGRVGIIVSTACLLLWCFRAEIEERYIYSINRGKESTILQHNITRKHLLKQARNILNGCENIAFVSTIKIVTLEDSNKWVYLDVTHCSDLSCVSIQTNCIERIYAVDNNTQQALDAIEFGKLFGVNYTQGGVDIGTVLLPRSEKLYLINDITECAKLGSYAHLLIKRPNNNISYYLYAISYDEQVIKTEVLRDSITRCAYKLYNIHSDITVEELNELI